MAKNIRTNAAVNRAEFDSLKNDVAQILALLTAPEAKVEKAPATKARSARKAKATPAKAPQGYATQRKAITEAKAAKKATKVESSKVTFVTRKTRPAFVKANPQFSGQTTGDIQRALIEGASFEGNWAVGPRTVEFFETGAYPASEPKAAKKGKKARKAKAVKVTAEVVEEAPAKAKRTPKARAEEPEYGTDAWIAWARPTDEGAPRRANGTAAPKSEWRLRIDLEFAGQFDRFEVDKIVAATKADA